VLWTDNVPLNFIKKQVNIGSSATLVRYSKMCREILVENFIKNGKMIGGPGKTVEIDESKYGKRKYHRGKAVEGQWVLGMLERESGAVVMLPVEKRDAATLIPLIKRWVAPETSIYTDCWKAYSTLSSEGYTHHTVNHSKHFTDPYTGANTNRIESSWRASKSAYSSSGRRKKYFSGYLAKYIFMKQCKIQETDPFLQFLSLCSAIDWKHPVDMEASDEDEVFDDDSE
jgi:transposase-like protein